MNNKIGKFGRVFALAALPFVSGCGDTVNSLAGIVGIGSTERADRVQLPYSREWLSIGHIKYGARGGCSGTLVAPSIVLTANHCTKTRSGRNIAPSSLSFNIVANPAADRQHSVIIDRAGVTRVIRPDFGGRRDDRPGVLGGDDIAYLILDRPLGNKYGTEDIATRSLAAGQNTDARQIGFTTKYGRHLMTGDIDCQIVPSANREGEINMNCNVQKGDSGGPVFVRQNGRWVIAGVTSSAIVQDVTMRSSAASVVGLPVPRAR